MRQGVIAHRIQAVRNFADVRAGDIGGYVSSEANLSQEGECWLYGNSASLEDARVTEDALLFDAAVARNAAEIKEHARITCEAIVEDYSTVRGSAHVGGGAVVRWSSTVSGNAKVYGHAVVTSAHICEKAEVYDSARITKSVIQGEAKVFDFLLHDRDVRQELRWARDEYRRKYPVYLEEREGMSGCWDVRLCYTKYRPKHDWAEEFQMGGVPVLQWHESCAGKMNKGIPDMFSGDLYEFMCYCMSATPEIQDLPDDIRNAWHTHKWVSRPSEADEKFCNFVRALNHPKNRRGPRLYRYGKLRPRRKPEYFTLGCYQGGDEE